MVLFEPRDPYPLTDESRHTHLDAQRHAEQVDRWLGLEVRSTETWLAQNGSRLKAPRASREPQQLWFGLDVQSLLTPYTDLRLMLSQINPQKGQTVVDLGAAYGRMGFVLARYWPESWFIGYEYVGERVREGMRCLKQHQINNARIEHADLSSPLFELPMADIYFIYDYGTVKAIDKTLHDLRRLSEFRLVTVIARGRNTRYAIDAKHPWLAKANPSASETRATIYRSNPPDSLRSAVLVHR